MINNYNPVTNGGGTLTDAVEALYPLVYFPNGNTGPDAWSVDNASRQVKRTGNKIHLYSYASGNSTYRDILVYGAEAVNGGTSYGDNYIKGLVTADSVIPLPTNVSSTFGVFSLYLFIRSNVHRVASGGSTPQIKLATIDTEGTVSVVSSFDIPSKSGEEDVLRVVPLENYPEIIANGNFAIDLFTRGSGFAGDMYFSIIALPKITTT